MSEENGWVEYRKLVLSEIERLDESIKGLSKKVDHLHTDVVVLKVKWTLIISAISAVVTLIVQHITK